MFGSVPGLPELEAESAGTGRATSGEWRECPSGSLALPGSLWVFVDPVAWSI